MISIICRAKTDVKLIWTFWYFRLIRDQSRGYNWNLNANLVSTMYLHGLFILHSPKTLERWNRIRGQCSSVDNLSTYDCPNSIRLLHHSRWVRKYNVEKSNLWLKTYSSPFPLTLSRRVARFKKNKKIKFGHKQFQKRPNPEKWKKAK